MSGIASRSWYLDPVVARQKADTFKGLVERWRDRDAHGPTLKTDLFEEANGEDALVPILEAGLGLVGIDPPQQSLELWLRHLGADDPRYAAHARLESLSVALAVSR